jgi:hypothetical protein
MKSLGFTKQRIDSKIWNLEFGIWNLEFGIWNLVTLQQSEVDFGGRGDSLPEAM